MTATAQIIPMQPYPTGAQLPPVDPLKPLRTTVMNAGNWMPIPKHMILELINFWINSGQEVTKDIALLDLQAAEDSRDIKPVRYYAKRWKWKQTRVFDLIKITRTTTEQQPNNNRTESGDIEPNSPPTRTTTEQQPNNNRTVSTEYIIHTTEEDTINPLLNVDNHLLCSTGLSDTPPKEDLPSKKIGIGVGEILTEPCSTGSNASDNKNGFAEKKRNSQKASGGQAETIYQAYPRKVGKIAALKAITTALQRVDYAELLERTQAYAAATSSWPPEDQHFIPHPATWYNQGRWSDDPATWERQQSKPAAPTGNQQSKGLDPAKLLTQEHIEVLKQTDPFAHKRFHIYELTASGKRYYLLPSDTPQFMPKEFVLLQPASVLVATV